MAAVSHEFRTPLASLRHVTELLDEDDNLPREQRRSFYEALGRNTERLHKLVESLLDFARMEEGRRPYDLQPLNVASLTATVVADFRKDARADRSTNVATLLLLPVAGGRPRQILRLTPSEALFRPGAWTPDSSALIIQKHTGSRWELWLVPVAGGSTRKLDIDPSIWRDGISNGGISVTQQGGVGSVLQQGDGAFSLSADGRRVALVIGKEVAEVWALENFLPALKPSR